MKQCGVLWILVGLLWTALLPLLSLAGSPDTGACVRLRNAIVDTSAVAQQARAGVLNAQNKMSADSESMLAQFDDADRRLPFIIQFAGPVQQAWKQAVEQTGARLGGYLPDNAFIVELTSDQLSQVAALESVQWVGPYKPDYKMDPTLSRRVAGAWNSFGPVAISDETFTIQTFSSETVSVVRDAVLSGKGRVLSVSASGRRGLLRVRMSVARASELLDLPEVEFIEVYVAPQLHNNVATDSDHMNVQSLWTSNNLTGSGQIVCVADTGLDTGNINTIHPDFSNRVIAAFALGRPISNDWSDSTSNGGHGTHVAGSVLGSGAAWSNGLFRGAAYEASLVFQSIMDSSGGLGGIPDSLEVLFLQAYTQGARIHTDSWGSSVYGKYTVDSQSADQFMWDVRDMLVLFSAGNSGKDANGNGVIDATAVGAPGTAKNVLTVGAAESKRPSGSGGYSAFVYGTGSWLPDYSAYPIRNDLISTAFDTLNQGMAAFSSRGPCIDGRIKPDIVAPGTDIISCRSRMPGTDTLWGTGSGVLANAASNYYTFCGGTSMSTPLTAGAAALVRQYLSEYRGFAAPSAALMKAVLVNGARSLSPGQYGTGQYREIPLTRPNNVEGWGQVDLANTLFPSAGGTNAYYDMKSSSDAMGTGGSKLYSFVTSVTNRLSITLCWSDYPASLSASEQLVNDLDLTVITPDGVVHYPNGLTSADRLNNVEGVDVSSVTPGTIQIRVSGYNVPNGPQPYALVIHGAEFIPAPAVEGDFDGDRLADPYWPVKSSVMGMWTIWRTSDGYVPAGPLNTPLAGGAPIRVADFEGDGLADLVMVADGNWYLWLSSSGFQTPQGPSFTMSVPSGVTVNWVAADFDGDRLADPALVIQGNWYIWLSNTGYPTPQVPTLALTIPGPIVAGMDWVAADFDGDRLADPALVINGNWYFYMSQGGYAQSLPFYMSVPGTDPVPMVGDFDGDRLSDPVMVADNNWTFWMSNGGYQPWGPLLFVP